jgi:hypothetical protein
MATRRGAGTAMDFASPWAALTIAEHRSLSRGDRYNRTWRRGPVDPRRPLDDQVSLREQAAALCQAGQVRCRWPSETPDREATRRPGADLGRGCYASGRSARGPLKLRGPRAPRRNAVQPGHLPAALSAGNRPSTCVAAAGVAGIGRRRRRHTTARASAIRQRVSTGSAGRNIRPIRPGRSRGVVMCGRPAASVKNSAVAVGRDGLVATLARV